MFVQKRLTRLSSFCMKIAGKVAVVTGGANGIGRALCLRFAAQGAKAVVISDIDTDGANRLAGQISSQGIQAEAIPANVAKEAEVKHLVDAATQKFGRIDIFCSNAGVGVGGGPEAADADWALSWDVNLMAHVYAARAVLPQMLARKEGYLLQTVSAAGLLTHIGSAPYSVTKHAAIGFAEWLAINYGERGIRVSALCPQGVRTNMLLSGGNEFLLAGALEPEQVADDVIKAMDEERFLILPHPEAGKFFLNKANDYDRWIRNMRKMRPV
jgi:NAD(P)-dependent dehydrogenase (short-subunit alcohol dehydrogenase family)